MYRFGNHTKEQTARAELRTIGQFKNESVRAYSARFSRLLEHLPQYDDAWAKDLFISGLTTRVAELLLLKNLPNLQDQMVEAERIEITMKYAQNTRAGGSHTTSVNNPTQVSGAGRGFRGGWRARGPGRRGGGRGPAGGRNGGRNQQRGNGRNQASITCYTCGGAGHMSAVCPSTISGRGGRHGERGGRTRGRSRGRFTANAGMVMNDDHDEDESAPSTSSQTQEN